MQTSLDISTKQYTEDNQIRSNLEVEESSSTLIFSPFLNSKRRCFKPSQNLFRKRSDLQSHTKTLLYFPNLQSSQTRRRRETSHRFITAKQTDNLPKVQNANCFKVTQQSTKHCILRKNRHLRRISPLSLTPKFSKIRSIFHEWRDLLLQSYAFWSKYRASDLHPSHKIPSISATQSRHNLQCLHGRLDNMEPERRPSFSVCSRSNDYSNGARIQNQSEKVYSQPCERDNLPGHNLERTGRYTSTIPRQIDNNLTPGSNYTLLTQTVSSPVPEISRTPELCSPINPSRTPSLLQGVTSPSIFSEGSSFDFSGFSDSSPMVVKHQRVGKTFTISPTTNRTDNMDRCVKTGVGGSNIKWPRDLIALEQTPERVPHNRTRVASNIKISTKPESSCIHNNSHQIRQQDCSFSNKQARISEIQSPPDNSHGTNGGMSGNSLPLESPTHSRRRKCVGRSTFQGNSELIRMDALSPNFSQTSRNSRTLEHRPVCPSRQQTNSEVRMQISSPRSNISGCSSSRLDNVGEHLSLPTSSTNARSNHKVETLCRPRSYNCTTPSQFSLVARTSYKSIKVRKRLVHNSKNPVRLGVLRLPLVLELSRLEFLNKIFSNKFEEEVAAKLIRAHRDSTVKQYQYCWKTFQDWLQDFKIEIISTPKVLKFLSFLVDIKGLAPRSTISYRNALHLPLLYGFNINTKSKPFTLLLNAQFIEHPPKKNVSPQWCLQKVLSLLSTAEFQTKKISKHNLMSKTLFLVALAAGNRVSEISAFDRKSVSFAPMYAGVTIAVRPGFLYKNERINNIAPNITIPALTNNNKKPHHLCPVNTLRLWLDASKDYTGPQFFFNIRSGKPLKAPQLSQLLVSLINSSQPGTFPKAHDIRKIAASLAWTRGIKIEEIIKRAFWKSSNVFISRYLVNVSINTNCVALGSC